MGQGLWLGRGDHVGLVLNDHHLLFDLAPRFGMNLDHQGTPGWDIPNWFFGFLPFITIFGIIIYLEIKVAFRSRTRAPKKRASS
jgi:hypothetical protein